MLLNYTKKSKPYFDARERRIRRSHPWNVIRKQQQGLMCLFLEIHFIPKSFYRWLFYAKPLEDESSEINVVLWYSILTLAFNFFTKRHVSIHAEFDPWFFVKQHLLFLSSCMSQEVVFRKIHLMQIYVYIYLENISYMDQLILFLYHQRN